MLGIRERSSLGLGIGPASELRAATAVYDKSNSARLLFVDDHGVTLGDGRGPFHTLYLETGALNQPRMPYPAFDVAPIQSGDPF